MQTHPQLQRCLTHCADCGIRFLTHPRNAGRRDLRCPFGCREHRRRERSNRRSAAYYQTAAGKRKKKRLNGRRHRPEVSLAAPPQGDRALPQGDLALPPASPHAPGGDASTATAELRLPGVVLDESSLARSPMLPHVRLLVGLIEGIELHCREVVDLLRQALRQHRIARRRRIDYVLGFLHQHPP